MPNSVLCSTLQKSVRCSLSTNNPQNPQFFPQGKGNPSLVVYRGDLMQIELYNFSKKNNSTKIPSTSFATILNCQLKDQVSFLSPVIIVRPNVIQGFSPAAFNYAHIPYWQRYYFITDWVYINACWECHLSLDYMASFRDFIGNSSQYILRSSYEKDGNISDNVYAIKTDYDVISTMLPTVFTSVYTGGFYILGIIGKNTQASVGVVTYYQMTGQQVKAFLDLLLTDTYFDQDIEINPSTLKAVFNPVQYITSCQWFPYAVSAIPSEFKETAGVINVGWWALTTGSSTAYKLKENVPSIRTEITENIPTHPQASRGNYLNHSPFTQHILRLAPFSDIVIADQYIEPGDKLRVVINTDVITGVGIMSVNILTSQNAFKVKISSESQTIGVPIQIAQIGVDYFGSISQMFKDAAQMTQTYTGTIGGLATGLISTVFTGDVNAGISAVTNYAAYDVTEDQLLTAYHYDVIKNTAPQLLTSGHNGSISDYKEFGYFITVFYKVTDADNARIGSPLCKVRTIKNIPGYILVQNPTIDINCTDLERKSIVATMAAGFYYE